MPENWCLPCNPNNKSQPLYAAPELSAKATVKNSSPADPVTKPLPFEYY
jgi:hypothetical protein